ncbi:MAG: hypothetical protein ACREF4_17590, partial [Gammaproteobacteria bacterium]
MSWEDGPGNPADRHGRRIAVLPPAVDPERWREHAAFRETFLLDFTSGRHNLALRELGRMLLELKSEGSSVVFPPLPSPLVRHELKAAAGDLRAVYCFLLEAVEAVGDRDSLVME